MRRYALSISIKIWGHMKKLADLTPTELENLSFDLLQKLGMKNVVWRTPGRDGGRDLQGECFIEDISGYTSLQSWYVDCKRYSSAVSWPTVWEKISFAESNSADVLLIITSSSLSPQAVDEVNKWNENRNRLAIRFWNSVNLETRLKLYPEVSIKYGLSRNPDEQKGQAVLPLTKILLKFSNSAHSCQVFETGNEARKLNVVYSVSELIANRLIDLGKIDAVSVYRFNSSDDSYDWLKGGEVIEKHGLDKYAFRALVSYCFDVVAKKELEVFEGDGSSYINLDEKIPDYMRRDLIDISMLSNFQVVFKENKIFLNKVGSQNE